MKNNFDRNNLKLEIKFYGTLQIFIPTWNKSIIHIQNSRFNSKHKVGSIVSKFWNRVEELIQEKPQLIESTFRLFVVKSDNELQLYIDRNLTEMLDCPFQNTRTLIDLHDACSRNYDSYQETKQPVNDQKTIPTQNIEIHAQITDDNLKDEN